MSLPDWILKYKEPKTEIKFVNGYYYKYALTYIYDPTKKRTCKKSSIMGSITQEEGFVLSNKFSHSKVEHANNANNVDIKTFGTFELFRNLIADEIELLSKYIESNTLECILTISLMRFAHQCPLKRIPYYHSHDFCSTEWVKNGLDIKKISSSLTQMGENRGLIVQWMQKQFEFVNTNKFIMIDSTHIHSLSEKININAIGYNPQKNYDPQIRLMYIFSSELKQPLYYRLINGNITDVSSMKNCVDELNVPNVIYVADKGFYSESNTDHLRINNLYYLIPLYRNNSLIDFKPLKEASYKKEIGTYFKYKNRIIWYYTYEKNGQKLITFVDEKLKVEEEMDYLNRIESHPENYKKEVFLEKMHKFGTLTLVHHLPKEYQANELYETYKQRNEVETMFDAYKNFLDADKTYMQNRYVLEGWLFANYIAMIAYYKLLNLLKEANLLSKYSPKDIIEISKSIYKTKMGDNWKTSEITKKINEIFMKIKIDSLN